MTLPDLREHLQHAVGTTYAIERELGRGGMARVFVATETALGRSVVIKVLPPDATACCRCSRRSGRVTRTAPAGTPYVRSPIRRGPEGGDDRSAGAALGVAALRPTRPGR